MATYALSIVVPRDAPTQWVWQPIKAMGPQEPLAQARNSGPIMGMQWRPKFKQDILEVVH